ncbi:hypothetical protein QYM36_007908 [Artemia franciscana]|uniref:DUF4371 domain-containing protein n=1 Tax=Artemia franciscana TaxID=6661 RepID=A0AA88LM00_ARTSF|nr:hypothetical protein QYM36_007908 [Artemia franciscana]
MCGQKEAKKLNSVLLLARISKEQISTLAENMKEQVIFALKQAIYFAIKLVETSDFSSPSQIMVYVRYTGADKFLEELLFSSPLELRSGEIDIYNKIKEYFNVQKFKMENGISVSLDGAPAMLGHINGFLALLKKNQILKLLTELSIARPLCQIFRVYIGSRHG